MCTLLKHFQSLISHSCLSQMVFIPATITSCTHVCCTCMWHQSPTCYLWYWCFCLLVSVGIIHVCVSVCARERVPSVHVWLSNTRWYWVISDPKGHFIMVPVLCHYLVFLLLPNTCTIFYNLVCAVSCCTWAQGHSNSQIVTWEQNWSCMYMYRYVFIDTVLYLHVWVCTCMYAWYSTCTVVQCTCRYMYT